MSSNYVNVLTDDEIAFILSLDEVISAKNKIDLKNSGSIYFSIELT